MARKALFATDTVVAPGAAGPDVLLRMNQSLTPGESLFSQDNNFELAFQMDGNVVWYQLPSTVLFATNTESSGADLFAMQPDGNLVLYAGSTVLFETNTDGNPGAYLSLQNDGNLVVYSAQVSPETARWTIPPNWRDGMMETLSFLTAVMSPPTLIEQRRGLRVTPRRAFEMGFTVNGPIRSFFDMWLKRAGGQVFAAPLWLEYEKLTAEIEIGEFVLSINTDMTEFSLHPAVFIQGSDPFDYDLIEVRTVSATEIELLNPVTKTWPAGTKVYPARNWEIEVQPQASRFGDRTYESRVKFQSIGENRCLDVEVPYLDSYLDIPVLTLDPNDIEELTYPYERPTDTVDGMTGLRARRDILPSAITSQAYTWMTKGRLNRARFRKVLYLLDGRRVPLWVPTFFQDLDLAANIAADAVTMDVRRMGFTDMGGPIEGREHIMIRLVSGARIYRKIISSVLVGSGATERLTVDTPFGQAITPAQVRRISFLAINRLNSDDIEIQHHTDSHGAADCSIVFRDLAGSIEHFQNQIPDPPATHIVYSIRLVIPTYEGPLFTITRESDDTSMDFFPVGEGGFYDQAQVDAFLDGTSVVGIVWYDQGSLELHLDQPPIEGNFMSGDGATVYVVNRISE